MGERDFQAAVLAGLDDVREGQAHIREVQAELKADMTGVKENLARLNGQTGQQQLRLTKLELNQARRRGADEEINSWMSRLWPGIWACVGAASMLVLRNADILLAALRR